MCSLSHEHISPSQQHQQQQLQASANNMHRSHDDISETSSNAQLALNSVQHVVNSMKNQANHRASPSLEAIDLTRAGSTTSLNNSLLNVNSDGDHLDQFFDTQDQHSSHPASNSPNVSSSRTSSRYDPVASPYSASYFGPNYVPFNQKWHNFRKNCDQVGNSLTSEIICNS